MTVTDSRPATTGPPATRTSTPGARPATAPVRARDPLLDLLRAVALLRVFVWHTFPAKWLTGFAAMPVMFFVAGTMLPVSTGWRSYATNLRRRGKRLLVPFWAYGLVLFTALFVLPPAAGAPAVSLAPRWSALSWVVPLGDPTGRSFAGGWLASHLWYLRAYLWIVVAAPLVLALARRTRRGAAVFAAAALVLAFGPRLHLPVVGAGTGRVIFGDLVCYGLFAGLGAVYARRRSAGRGVAGGWRAAAIVSAVLTAASVAYVVAEGLPAEGVNGSYPAIVLTGLAWLAGLLALEGPLRRLAGRPRVASTVEAISGRALTVYLWHPAGIVVARALIGPTTGLAGASVLALAAAVTLLFVAAFGRLEDAARSRPAAVPAPLPAPLPAARPAAAPRPAHARAHTPNAHMPSGLSTVGAAALLTAVAVAGFAVAQVRPAGASADGTEAIGKAGLAPSFREALRNDEFATVRKDAPTPAAQALSLRQEAPAGAVPPSTAPSAASAAASVAPSDPEVVARPDFEAAFDRWFASHPDLDTAVVAVDLDGKLWKAQRFRDPAHPHHKVDDTYTILSVTKTFTAALTLQAMERGELRLDDPVPALDGIDGPAHPVTARQLLTHTSGLVDYTEAKDYDPKAPLDARAAVNLSTHTEQRSWPGKVVHYANSNFLYLQLVLEKVTGRPFEDLMAGLVGQVGLRYTKLEPPNRPGWAAGGAGGIRSSVPDLALWAKALFTPGRVLQPGTVPLLTTLDEHNLGLGTWPICPCWTDETGAKRYTAIGHHVGSGGVFLYPATGITVAMRIEPQSDAAGGLAAELGAQLSDLVAGGAAGPATTAPAATVAPTTAPAPAP